MLTIYALFNLQHGHTNVNSQCWYEALTYILLPVCKLEVYATTALPTVKHQVQWIPEQLRPERSTQKVFLLQDQQWFVARLHCDRTSTIPAEIYKEKNSHYWEKTNVKLRAEELIFNWFHRHLFSLGNSQLSCLMRTEGPSKCEHTSFLQYTSSILSDCIQFPPLQTSSQCH